MFIAALYTSMSMTLMHPWVYKQPTCYIRTMALKRREFYNMNETQYDSTYTCQSVSSVSQSCPALCNPTDCSKNTGVGGRFLLQEIFLIQGSNQCLLPLLHWQADSLPLCYLTTLRQCVFPRERVEVIPPRRMVAVWTMGKPRLASLNT